jgi:hexokinase
MTRTTSCRYLIRDAQIVRWACSLVARRAALLSGVAVAATLLQTGRASFPDANGKHALQTNAEKIWVGVDGRLICIALLIVLCIDHPVSLIEHYPNFERILRESLRTLVGEEVEMKVDIGLAQDGSGVGGKSIYSCNWPIWTHIVHYSCSLCSAGIEAR